MLISYPQQTLPVSKYGTIWLDKNTTKDLTKTGILTMHYNTGNRQSDSLLWHKVWVNYVHFRIYALKQNLCGYIWIICYHSRKLKNYTWSFTNMNTPKPLNSSVMICEKWQRSDSCCNPSDAMLQNLLMNIWVKKSCILWPQWASFVLHINCLMSHCTTMQKWFHTTPKQMCSYMTTWKSNEILLVQCSLRNGQIKFDDVNNNGALTKFLSAFSSVLFIPRVPVFLDLNVQFFCPCILILSGWVNCAHPN